MNQYKHKFLFGEPFGWSITWGSSVFGNISVADDYSTLENISVCLKQCPEEDEDDKYMQLFQRDEANVLTGKVSFDTATHTLTINPAPSDFANIEKGKVYKVVIAWKVSDFPEYIEASYKVDKPGDDFILIKNDEFFGPQS